MMPGALSIVLDERFHNETARMAFSLAGRFGERGAHVGLWGENSLDYLTALFALPRAGYVAVPLQTRLSGRELADIVRGADLPGILTASSLPAALEDALGDVSIYPLARELDSAARGQVEELREEDAAVLLCSSGSAGRVKMIPLTRRELFDHARAVCEHLTVTSRDSWLACLPFYHIGGLAIAFRCLVSGATLVMAENSDTKEINRVLDSGEASLVSVVPTMLERMLAAREGKPYPPSLRAIIVGGGPVPAELLKRCPQAYATYGLTEAGSMVTCARPGCGEGERRTCGPPIPGTQVRILSETGE
jgi:O-succinylbenzoic acid--CoA ligase